MGKIRTRDELKSYCLRKLGDPVIKINVADVQLDDRIDEALQYYHERHHLGSERAYYIHTITQEDIDNGYIDVETISTRIIDVTKLVSLENGLTSSSFMSSAYQYRLSIYDQVLSSTNAIDYYLGMQHLELINKIFEKGDEITFNKNSNKLKIHTKWSEVFEADESTIAFECWEYIDENDDNEAFSDEFLKEYATQLIKKQWGENLKLMKGIQLVGGIELDGQTIWDEADKRLEEMREEQDNFPLGVYLI